MLGKFLQTVVFRKSLNYVDKSFQNEYSEQKEGRYAMSVKHLRFVVHEHKSKRLHYDFRLEIGGVLKSWAIPKGPSMNPADKRLAVMVPDHDLIYIDFEGVIPKGSYGAGPVVVWDTGGFIPLDTDDPQAAITQGKLSFELNGKKLKGAFALALMKGLPKSTGKEWLLMKKMDSHAKSDYAIKTELTPAKLAKLKEKVPPCETD
jgi:bifunctional non-homologous end joining protein LigD